MWLVETHNYKEKGGQINNKTAEEYLFAVVEPLAILFLFWALSLCFFVFFALLFFAPFCKKSFEEARFFCFVFDLVGFLFCTLSNLFCGAWTFDRQSATRSK
ncbi:MAG: hypothetical protein AAF985_17820 [Bacteroidota bacterium]